MTWAALAVFVSQTALPQVNLPRQAPDARSPRKLSGPNQVPSQRGLLPPRQKLGQDELIGSVQDAIKRDPWVYPIADQLRFEADGSIVASGNVLVKTVNQTIQAQRFRYDPVTKIASLSGDIHYLEDGIRIDADAMAVNVDSYDFDAREAKVVIDASRTGGTSLQAMRFSAARARRTGKVINAEDGVFTTCDIVVPHGDIGFSSAMLIADERLVLRNATIRRYERRVAAIRHLSVPLKEKRPGGWLPAFGRTNEEGYFIKAAIGYAVAAQLPGLLRVDLMERKGIGLGFDQVYRYFGASPGAGRLVVYDLQDNNRGVHNRNIRFEHEQRVGELDFRLNSDQSSNSYQSAISGSQTRSNGITVLRQSPARPFNLTFVDGLSGSSFAKSGTRTLTTSQGFKIGNDFTGSVKYSSIANQTSSGTVAAPTLAKSQRELAELTARGVVGPFDAQLQANRNLSNKTSGQSGTSAFFGGTERLPEIRLQLKKPPTELAGVLQSATLGYGRFLESSLRGGLPQAVGTNRFLADINAKPIEQKIGAAQFRSSSRFLQTIYDGGVAAQYVLDHSTTLGSGGEDGAGWNLTYRYNRPYGGVPVGFRLDRTGSSNIVAASRTFATDRLSASFGTAFDIERSREPLFPGSPRRPWTNLQAQVSGVISPRLAARTQIAWDPNTKAPVSMQYGIQAELAEQFFSDIALSYEPRLHQWTQLAGRLGGWVFGRDTRIMSQLSYSGFSKKFDYRSLAVEHAFHDYVLTVAYIDQPFGFRSEKGINVGLRLRAFPVGDIPQTGRFGTARDAGFGGFGGQYGLQDPFFTSGQGMSGVGGMMGGANRF
ncbi:MAG: hypothetical protein RLZZ78_401 [Armatimonadota bacterium]